MLHLYRNVKKDRSVVEIVIATRTVVKIVLVVVISLLLLTTLRMMSHALLLIFTSFFLALALNAPVHFLASRIPGKRRGSRAVATTISFLIVVILLGLFLWSMVPAFIHQTESFIGAAPRLVHSLHNQQGGIGAIIHRYHLEGQVNTLSQQLGSHLKNVGGKAVSTAGHILSSVFSVLAILALTFMMLVEGPRWLRFIKRLFPENQQPEVERLAGDMYQVVKGYVNGQVTLALLAAILISPALFVLHISYPIALIAVIFICGLIPLVGHTIGAVIVTLVALAHSVPSALIILAYYILYQQVENYLIQPRIQANSTNMSPLLVFMAVIIGISFSGLFGGLVAIPVAGCLRILALDYLYDHKLLNTEPAV